MTNLTDMIIVKLSDLLTPERNIRSINEESLMLCRETVENAIPGTSEQWLPIYEQHTEGLLFMVNQEQKIVGLCTFFALNEILIQRIIQGKLEDEQITLNEVVPMKTNGIYNVYVTFFGVKKEYRCLKVIGCFI